MYSVIERRGDQVARAVHPETVRLSSAVDRAQSILRSQHERLESPVVPGVTRLRPSQRQAPLLCKRRVHGSPSPATAVALFGRRSDAGEYEWHRLGKVSTNESRQSSLKSIAPRIYPRPGLPASVAALRLAQGVKCYVSCNIP